MAVTKLYQNVLHRTPDQGGYDWWLAVEMVTQAKKRFPSLAVCSFDKGFHSKTNQEKLKEQIEQVVLPRKGKLSRQAKEIESAPEFVRARRAHSAVESAINGLEVHGLDVCLDHGIEGFKRYVAWAVVARNIHRIGAIVWQQEVTAPLLVIKAPARQGVLAIRLRSFHSHKCKIPLIKKMRIHP